MSSAKSAIRLILLLSRLCRHCHAQVLKLQSKLRAPVGHKRPFVFARMLLVFFHSVTSTRAVDTDNAALCQKSPDFRTKRILAFDLQKYTRVAHDNKTSFTIAAKPRILQITHSLLWKKTCVQLSEIWPQALANWTSYFESQNFILT